MINLLIGLWYGRRTKSHRDYAIAGKKLPSFTIIATLVTALWSSNTFYWGIEQIYTNGLVGITILLCKSLSLCFIGSYIAHRAATFLNHVSLPESIGSIYGASIRKMMAVIAVISCIITVSMQFFWGGEILQNLFHIDSQISIIVIALAITLYTSLGGIRSVAFTGVLQFSIFAIIIPIIAYCSIASQPCKLCFIYAYTNRNLEPL